MHRALHSRTTGLPNRTLLRSTLDSLLQEDNTPGFSVILLSINNFHEFNKTLGHSNGDAILYVLTERLNSLSQSIQRIVPIEDTDARLNYVANVEGVSFALIVRELDPDLVHALVLGLLRDMEKPFEYQGLTLDVDATAGIAFHPAHGSSSENLLRNAHIALEAAGSTNEKFAIYSQEIDPYNQRRISLLGELRNAIEKDALQLYFQPQICLDTLQVSGAEVLIRWIHPEYGFIPPDEFIPLAERTGVIQPLTYWICRKAFAFKKSLSDQGYDINLSINISARNLQDPHFKDQICKIAQECDITLDKVIMELTETAVMHNPDDAMRVMGELSAVGIRLSIDDFGTGYSSLSYLKKLPVNEIKIDRSFVMEMAKNSDDQVIVHTTLTMGHNMSLEVVAEGIEDEDTLNKLKEMGCDLAQGYHIARPMPANEFFTWLANYAAKLNPTHSIKSIK
ncbi:MAG: GGDEF-domain containing protein [Alcanivorax sp.]|nr:MAG: GGDEF-domain containing protein [Alcanivorax sp.]